MLVRNAHCGIENIGQRYCDRAECKNGFDAIRNQWGWGVTGITGHEERAGRYRPGQYGLDNQDMDGFGRVRHRRWIRNWRSPHQGVIEEVTGAVTGVLRVLNRHGCACFV